jgi:hypothetical protein
MNDTTLKPDLPDHLLGNPRSSRYVEAISERKIGILLNGKECFILKNIALVKGSVGKKCLGY